MLTTIHVTTRPKGLELWIKSCYDLKMQNVSCITPFMFVEESMTHATMHHLVLLVVSHSLSFLGIIDFIKPMP